MPTEKWFVWWKRNRNHKGEEIVYSEKKAMALVEEKKESGFKKTGYYKLPRHHKIITPQ